MEGRLTTDTFRFRIEDVGFRGSEFRKWVRGLSRPAMFLGSIDFPRSGGTKFVFLFNPNPSPNHQL